MAKRTCTVDGCDRPGTRRGWCSTHYSRWRTHGTTDDPRPTAEQRFWAKVDKGGPVPDHRPDLGPCWIWTASLTPYGYGQFNPDNRPMGAYRWAWLHFVGPIPTGHEPDHLCRNRKCVNYQHLEIVTREENKRRAKSVTMLNASKTHCVRGHEFTEANTYRPPGSPNKRMCRTCGKMRAST